MKVRSKGALAIGAALMTAAMAAGPAAAQSTTITPAGDYSKASLQSGTTASFSIAGFLTTTCNQSVSQPTSPLGTNTKNKIPAAPGNHNNNGPVTIPVNPPTFTNNGGACPTNIGATTTTTTSGSWTLSGQNGSPITGYLTVPRNGAVVSTSNGCTITIAPSAAVNVNGTWTNGSGSTPSRLTITNQPIPVSVSGGFGCFGSSASFSATYDVTDVSNTSAFVTVGP
ncbi:MAG TPA: hypothetical protein VF715_04885 [Thermoleophilaceae bacterium]|jgi:hypothetical protein